MRRDMKEHENEKYVRALNEAAHHEAELSRVKAQLWRRIAAAMKEIPSTASQEASRLGGTTPRHPRSRH
jgi:hypothetical protein